MTGFNKKIIYTLLAASLAGLSGTGASLCAEKINAGVVYEFYLDIPNQIPSNTKIDVKKLPEITDEEVNLAFYKDFRPLNMLSMRSTYTIASKSEKRLKYERIPESYTISLNTQKIAAAAKITPSFRELLASALNFKNKEKYKDALENVNLAIEKNPLSVEAHFLKADILRQSGNYRDSVLEYTLAINIDPKCTDAYYNIAKILENSGQKELALEYFRYAYSTKPDDYEIRNIILSYEKSGIN